MTPRALQSALWATYLATSAALADPPRVSIAVDVSGIDAAAQVDRGALEAQAATRLVQEGFAVVAQSAQPMVIVRLVSAGALIEVQCQSGPVTRTRRVPASPTADLLDAVVAMAKEPPPTGAPEGAPAPATTPSPAPPPPEAAAPPSPLTDELPAAMRRRTTLSLGVSALWRGAADPTVSLGLRRGGPVGLGLAAEVALTPSVGPGVSVQETAVLIGASYRWELRRGVDLDVGGRVGLLARYDSLTNPQTSPASSWDATLLLLAPVEVVSWLSPKTSFGMRLAPGIAASSPSIVDGGTELWFRHIFRIEAGVSLQHTF